MRRRTILLCVCLAPIVAAVIYAAVIGDATRTIRGNYPSARVYVHHGHSDPRPVLGFVRMIRGREFVPTSEWVDVSIDNETKPIDFALLRSLQVTFLELDRCRTQDLTAIEAFGYVVFSRCDLSGVPQHQLAALRPRSDDPTTLIYGGP